MIRQNKGGNMPKNRGEIQRSFYDGRYPTQGFSHIADHKMALKQHFLYQSEAGTEAVPSACFVCVLVSAISIFDLWIRSATGSVRWLYYTDGEINPDTLSGGFLQAWRTPILLSRRCRCAMTISQHPGTNRPFSWRPCAQS